MNYNHFLSPVFLIVIVAGAVFIGQDMQADRDALVKALWPQGRILDAMKAVEQQRRDGLLSQESYEKRMAMLKARLAGTYVSESLSVSNPPPGFESKRGRITAIAKNGSHWLAGRRRGT